MRKYIYLSVVILLVFFYCFLSFKKTFAATASPGGTYTDWYFPSGSYDSHEWTLEPVKDPPVSLAQAGLLHYYAYNFGVVNSTNAVGNGYAGFQTNGIFRGASQGKVINFSFWGSTGGHSSLGMIEPANTESNGYQIMLKYAWSINHKYKFQLKLGPSGIDSQGKWWGLWVTDSSSNITTFVGEERLPTTIGGNSSDKLSDHTSFFGEDTHWWRSVDGIVKYQCSDFESSSMAAIDISANNSSVKPSSVTSKTNSGEQTVSPTNGYLTINCSVSIYSNNKDVQHNLGYWATSAPNVLPQSNSCPLKSRGDADCDNKITLNDFGIWSQEFLKIASTKNANFDNNSTVDIADFNIWSNGYRDSTLAH